ncbi:unnamed protein product, partial [Darwinula stevensoni]
DNNPILDIPREFFMDMGNLEDFDCGYCGLGPTLLNGSMEFHSPALKFIYLNDNGISRMESHAITAFNTKSPSIIRMPDGIMCDCSIAWFVLTPELRGSVKGYCPDHTRFDELHPEDFQDCIMKDPTAESSTWITSDQKY